jgi:hypothetical protein
MKYWEIIGDNISKVGFLDSRWAATPAPLLLGPNSENRDSSGSYGRADACSKSTGHASGGDPFCCLVRGNGNRDQRCPDHPCP